MEILSKNIIKLVKSLQIKKYRSQEELFLVEGEKSVEELLKSDFQVEYLIGTESYFKGRQEGGVKRIMASSNQLSSIGSFANNNTVLAVVNMKKNQSVVVQPEEWAIGLDFIQDPGNLGTIIRIADWYGISKLICSEDCVDVYNPKTISASKGSFTRVQLYYTDLAKYIEQSKCSAYGATLSGENVYRVTFPKGGLLVMGNESNGIRPELLSFIQHQITIPSRGSAESLNVGIATGILCDNLFRGA